MTCNILQCHNALSFSVWILSWQLGDAHSTILMGLLSTNLQAISLSCQLLKWYWRISCKSYHLVTTGFSLELLLLLLLLSARMGAEGKEACKGGKGACGLGNHVVWPCQAWTRGTPNLINLQQVTL